VRPRGDEEEEVEEAEEVVEGEEDEVLWLTATVMEVVNWAESRVVVHQDVEWI